MVKTHICSLYPSEQHKETNPSFYLYSHTPATCLAPCWWNTIGVAYTEWVCIDLPGLLWSHRQQVGGVVVASVQQLWWYLPLIKFLPERESSEGVKGDKNLSEQSAVQQSILSPLPFRTEPGRMDGRQVSHLGKLERSNKRAIAQPLPEETEEQCLHPLWLLSSSVFQWSSSGNLFSTLWSFPWQ